MGREVLDDADVAHAVGERADALGGDQEHLAELALLRAPAQLEQRGVEALDVADRGVDAGRPARVDDLARLRPPSRPAASRRARGRPRRRGCARRRRAPRSAPRRSRSRASRRAAGRRGRRTRAPSSRTAPKRSPAGIDGAGERDARRGLQQPRVVAADHARARARRRAAAWWSLGLGTAPLGYPPCPITPPPVSSSARRPPSARDVSFGANVVVHDGVVIGDGVVVQDGAVLGKPPRAGADLAARRATELDALVIEDGRGGLRAGRSSSPARTSARARSSATRSFVRERAPRRAPNSVVGRGSAIDNDVVIGARVSVQTNVYVTGFSVVEDDVFLGPCAMTTNDDTMARHAAGRCSCAARRCGAPAGSAAARCSCPASRSARRPSWPPAPSSPNDVPARAVVMGVPAPRRPRGRRRGPAGSLEREASASYRARASRRWRGAGGCAPSGARAGSRVAALLTGGAVGGDRARRASSAPRRRRRRADRRRLGADSEAARPHRGGRRRGARADASRSRCAGTSEGSHGASNALLNLLGSFTIDAGRVVPALDARDPPARALRPVRRPRPAASTTSITSCPGSCSPSSPAAPRSSSRNEALRRRGSRSPSAPAWRLTLDESGAAARSSTTSTGPRRASSACRSRCAVVSMLLGRWSLALRMLRRGERVRARGRAERARSGRRRRRRRSPASVQMTWSRPGPTPTSTIGTPTDVRDEAQVVARGLGQLGLASRQPVMSSFQPGSSVYSPVAWCRTVWW